MNVFEAYLKVKHATRSVAKLSIEENPIGRVQTRILDSQSSLWVVLVGVGQRHGQNEAEEDEEEREDELADDGLPEPHGVVGSLEEHGTELLKP